RRTFRASCWGSRSCPCSSFCSTGCSGVRFTHTPRAACVSTEEAAQMLDTLPPVTTGLLEARGVRQAFPKPAGGEVVVLDNVDIALREGEIVGLLGRSGCGKSTLLRIIAGLIRPSAGEVRYEGKPLRGPAEGIAMVFQTFALFPWLSVLENAEIGLEARG